jgi:hypothetical protein
VHAQKNPSDFCAHALQFWPDDQSIMRESTAGILEMTEAD